jgi:hypothetical protein
MRGLQRLPHFSSRAPSSAGALTIFEKFMTISPNFERFLAFVDQMERGAIVQLFLTIFISWFAGNEHTRLETMRSDTNV